MTELLLRLLVPGCSNTVVSTQQAVPARQRGHHARGHLGHAKEECGPAGGWLLLLAAALKYGFCLMLVKTSKSSQHGCRCCLLKLAAAATGY